MKSAITPLFHWRMNYWLSIARTDLISEANNAVVSDFIPIPVLSNYNHKL